MATPRPYFPWHLRTQTLTLGSRTLLAGIVNVTPDSFSDGGHHATPPAALDHALYLLDRGADLLDLGGESTRPGAPALTSAAISAAEEQRRVLPVLHAILRARPGTVVSVDTYRSGTAQRALDAGAEIINDVSGLLWDPGMAATVAAARCGLILMHTRGLPSKWAAQPPLAPADIVPTVLNGLSEQLGEAHTAGLPHEHIVLDPGFGFGKRGTENWTLLAHLEHLQRLRRPILVGLSRKGFLTANQPTATLDERDRATHTAGIAAILNGAHILRVHDVSHARHAADLADQLVSSDGISSDGIPV